MDTENKAEPGSQRVTFTRDYDYTWPSRVMTHYPEGYTGRVKGEVAEAALAAGAAREPNKGEKDTKPGDVLPGNLDSSLATPDALTPNLSNGANSE